MATSLMLFALVALLGNVHSQSGDLLEVCRNKEMDIYFLLDSSTSIYINDYREELNFVRTMINHMDVDSSYTRVGVLTFSESVTFPQSLRPGGFQTVSNVRSLISENNLPYLTGITNTDQAIRTVRELREQRDDITKVMVVVTDGGSRSQGSTAREAQLAREEGFYMYVVGVGQYRDEAEWRSIATSQDFIFNMTDFNQLNNFAYTISSRACPLPPIVLGQCDVNRYSHITFVGTLAAVDRVMPIIENFVSKVEDDRRYLQASFLLDTCPNALNIDIDSYQSYCSRIGSSSVRSYEQLLEEARTNIAADSQRSQTLVLFTEYGLRVYGNAVRVLLDDLMNYGVNVVVVTLDQTPVENSLRSLTGSDKFIAFNSAAVDTQTRELREMVEETCLAINTPRFGNIPAFEPNK